jgi:type IV secretory pathway VirB4 component
MISIIKKIEALEKLSIEDKNKVVDFINNYIRSIYEERSSFFCYAEVSDEGEVEFKEGDSEETIESNFAQYWCEKCGDYVAINNIELIDHVFKDLGLNENRE